MTCNCSIAYGLLSGRTLDKVAAHHGLLRTRSWLFFRESDGALRRRLAYAITVVKRSDGRVVCTACKGLGFFYNQKVDSPTVVCTTCHGKGYVDVVHGEVAQGVTEGWGRFLKEMERRLTETIHYCSATPGNRYPTNEYEVAMRVYTEWLQCKHLVDVRPFIPWLESHIPPKKMEV
jgi:hypothetical protein